MTLAGRVIKSNERIGKISLILIIAFVAYIIWTIIDAYAYGKSDFVLEMNNASTMNEKLTLFAIEGESYKGGICPSGQCTLDHVLDPSFGPPTVNNMGMHGSFGFGLHDSVPNANIGPKKQEYLEEFSVSMYCYKFDDIIEDNGQEIYTCSNGSTTVTRDFDSRSWDYNTNLIFDAKKNTVKVYGNYTHTG